MPIRAFIGRQSFDPAFLAVCEALGLSDTADGVTELVASRVIELTDGQRDPQEIRAAALASFKK